MHITFKLCLSGRKDLEDGDSENGQDSNTAFRGNEESKDFDL